MDSASTPCPPQSGYQRCPPPPEIHPRPSGQTRFGASVKLRAVRIGAETERNISIVGVDDANAAERRISFIALMARTLMGKKQEIGCRIRTGLDQTPPRFGPESFEIVEISYEAE